MLDIPEWVQNLGLGGLALVLVWQLVLKTGVWVGRRLDKFIDGLCVMMTSMTDSLEGIRGKLQSCEEYDQATVHALASLKTSHLSRHQAAEIGERACDVLDAVVKQTKMESDVIDTVHRLRESFEKIHEGSNNNV